MTPERAHAYRRVLHTLEELGPSKLQADEQQRIRDAVDSLLFSSDLDSDPPARAALQDVSALARALVESGRWEHATAAALVEDISQCGPALVPELKAA